MTREGVKLMSLTEVGAQARDSYDPRESPANTCTSFSMPAMLHAPYLYDIRVDQDAQSMTVYHEYFAVTRTIPLEAEALAEPGGYFGTVRGSVDGDQIVVESWDYPESAWGLAVAVGPFGGGADIPSSTQKRVTERYSVNDDGSALYIDITVEDPVYLAEPYTTRAEYYRVADDTPLYGYDCDEDSARRFTRDL